MVSSNARDSRDFVLAGMQWQTCLLYLDCHHVGQEFDEHLERLREVKYEEGRKRKVKEFNLLNLCSVPNPVDHQHNPNKTASAEPNTSGQRPHVPATIFMMKLISCTWMMQVMWKLQSPNVSKNGICSKW